jgi:ribosomal protein S17E
MSTDKALKQKILSAIQEMYYITLRNRITGYATVTTRQILAYLYAT